MSPAPAAVWIDSDHDREYASDGISRHGAYLRDSSWPGQRTVAAVAAELNRIVGPILAAGDTSAARSAG